jgi:hypothetical protein
MMTQEEFRKMALSFENSEELPHFENTSFRVKGKIFATMNLKENRVCLKLNEIDQDVFCSFDKKIMWPVPHAWGKQGWTLAQLDLIHPDMLSDALQTAYATRLSKTKKKQ